MDMIPYEELEEVQVAEDYFHLQACICFVVGLVLGLAFKVASRLYENPDQESLWQLIRQATADFFTCRPHVALAMAQPLSRTKSIPIDIAATQKLDTWTSDPERNVQWRILERDIKSHYLRLNRNQNSALEDKMLVDGQKDLYEEITDESNAEFYDEITDESKAELYEEITDDSKAELPKQESHSETIDIRVRIITQK